MDENNYTNTISGSTPLNNIEYLEPEEPKNGFFDNLADKFGTVLSGMSGVAGAVVPQIADITQFNALIDKQVYWQTQMQLYTAESNIEKSRHEVLMSPIRNLRVS